MTLSMALSLYVMGDRPGGHPMHFWAPEYTRSMPQASVKKGSPTRVHTVSTTRRVPFFLQSSPTRRGSAWCRWRTLRGTGTGRLALLLEDLGDLLVGRGEPGLLPELDDLSSVPEAL